VIWWYALILNAERRFVPKTESVMADATAKGLRSALAVYISILERKILDSANSALKKKILILLSLRTSRRK
jgi:hypothetical protein